ncbi:MAG: ketol-acid reductoisomerase, partial [Deltaproteobacteria bacterium]|nr:ketol-acid reductoisomerase [Deltaproteobacteria bacterium]
LITPRPDLDVVLVAPKGQGQGVRDAYLAGGGVLALVAVSQDATGRALETALAWAAGLGSHRTAILQTTFRAETETDLFGEQAVLCGGVTALMTAAFETLTDAGYPPEMAYTECCHELKLIVDLIHAGGIEYMRRRISTTARFGDVSRGPRIIDEHVRRTLQEILNEVRDGRFAREFLTPSSAPRGAPGGSAALEQVGAYVRNLLLDKAR